jgi:hypothetical protein
MPADGGQTTAIGTAIVVIAVAAKVSSRDDCLRPA